MSVQARRAEVVLADVREGPLSVDEVYAAVRDERAGGVVVFVGTVRDRDHGKAVDILEYTCHPSAGEATRRLADRHSPRGRVLRIAVVHRLGRLHVGEPAVVAAVGAEHRAEAFEVCRALVDELKASVPIWKYQVFTDGTDEWVGTP